MRTLYQSGNAGDFELIGSPMSSGEFDKLKYNTCRLLKARGQSEAAHYLHSIPFRMYNAYNHFNDEFNVLLAELPLEQYEEIGLFSTTSEGKNVFIQIAKTIGEIGPYVRLIKIDLEMKKSEQVNGNNNKLKDSEIHKLVYKYIGVSGGYLGDFSYPSHREFYKSIDVDVDPNKYEGTTRERFIQILNECSVENQAKILEGILERYPVLSSEIRTQEKANMIKLWVARLKDNSVVEIPEPHVTSEVVKRALTDAEQLLKTSGATSCVDRIHTALHGYLRAVCMNENIQTSEDAGITEVFKQIREHHPAFKNLGPRAEDIGKAIRSMSTILDVMNPLRNQASIAHPNDNLLAEPEAMLVINSARTILVYVDSKLKELEEKTKAYGS